MLLNESLQCTCVVSLQLGTCMLPLRTCIAAHGEVIAEQHCPGGDHKQALRRHSSTRDMASPPADVKEAIHAMQTVSRGDQCIECLALDATWLAACPRALASTARHQGLPLETWGFPAGHLGQDP